jgi:hypothetical protein
VRVAEVGSKADGGFDRLVGTNSPPLAWVMERRALAGNLPGSEVMASAARSASLPGRRRAGVSRLRLSCSVSRRVAAEVHEVRRPRARTCCGDAPSSGADGSASGNGSRVSVILAMVVEQSGRAAATHLSEANQRDYRRDRFDGIRSNG